MSSHNEPFDSRQGMADRQLARIKREMSHVAGRTRSKTFWSLLAVLGTVATLFSLMIRAAQQTGQIPEPAAWAMIGGMIIAMVIVSAMLARQIAGGALSTAEQIEDHFPGLGERLVTTADLTPEQTKSPLAQHLIGETHDHFRSHHWQQVVSAASLWTSRLFGAGALTAAVVVPLMRFHSDDHSLPSAAALLNPTLDQQVTVLPGDVELERGTSLVVTAEFSQSAPESATLVTEAADQTINELPMKRNLKDPIVGGFVSQVDQSMTYHVVTDTWSSEPYSVTVFEYPELIRSDAELRFPQYTNMTQRNVEDTFKVSVVEGTEVTWKLLLNKPVETCRLTDEDGMILNGNLVTSTTDPSQSDSVSARVTYQVKMVAEKSARYTLDLQDDDGRENKFPPELSIKVLPNKPPKLKLEKARDQTVSALQELPLRANVRDDYGVIKSGLTYTIENRPEVSVELGTSQGRNVDSPLEYLLNMEDLKSSPDELLTFYFWAEDTGPDGKPRRTESDLYFIDVRAFEEIFLEADAPQSPPSQGQPQSQAQQQAEELAKLQKEIITAIWNQIRLEFTGKTPLSEDIQVISDSQTDAIGQFEELAQELQDPKSVKIGQAVLHSMQATVKNLSEKDLPESRGTAQASFSGLLKLRSREFEISRQQRQQQQSAGGSASQNRQQQIDELELDEEQNRYETQQQAQQQTAEQQAASEDRQVLSRLRELAKRTEDLTEELAKLQTALEQAEDPETEEQVRRQLERLREQQQELLRLSDELESRMRSPENSERMSEQADQLQESRDELRQATKATEENDASAALAAGRRAERQLDELQEEFRQRAAGAFDETLRQMQRDAETLQNEQKKIGESMREQVEDAAPGLRGDEQTAASPEQLEQQAQRFRQLMEQMEQTVKDADESEPLLAERLYDGFRQAGRSQAERQLENAAELVRRGFMPQAEQFEQEAAKGIDQLREDIDEAAGAVLGDATEGLRRASQRLEQLTEGVEQELNQQAQREGEGQQPGQPPGQQPG
ncbi:hypothetical protein NHH03_26715, partial [Stieleria sp. TO1_6]|uniref:hypothetical protein n=1 Tax=Stieleria tagensis TaxID=2956795 RepID=UPI00209B77E0